LFLLNKPLGGDVLVHAFQAEAVTDFKEQGGRVVFGIIVFRLALGAGSGRLAVAVLEPSARP
jgi:hypothetical protein